MINKSKHRWRGFKIILSISIMLAISTNFAYAATSDDLKAYLGYTVEKHEPTKINPYQTDDKKVESNEDILDEQYYNDLISNLDKKLINLEAQLKLALDTTQSPQTIVAYIMEIDSTKEDIETANKEKLMAKRHSGIDTIVQDYSLNIREATKNADAEFNGFLYEIGSIGDTTVSPVKGYFKLIEPYGYKVDLEGNIIQTNTHIKLAANAKDKIISLWNGYISSIEPDIESDNGTYSMLVNHGNGLVTIYGNLYPGSYYAGNKVEQGDVLGEASSTGYITLEIILEGKNINPLHVYGVTGEKAYKDWAVQTADDFRLPAGEVMYHRKSDEKVNPNNGTYDEFNFIDGAIKTPEGYTRPDPSSPKVD